MQKTQNEEPVSGNSLEELAPPTNNFTVVEKNYNLGSEVNAENENEEGASLWKFLGETGPPGAK